MNERHEFNDANNDFHIYNTVYITFFKIHVCQLYYVHSLDGIILQL